MSDNARIENIRLAREAAYLDGDDDEDEVEDDREDREYDAWLDAQFDQGW